MKTNENNINSASTDFKRTIVPFQEQTIRNNFMFGEVMKDGNNCKEFLELVLNKKIRELQIIQNEKTILPHPDYHGVRLDVFVRDDEGTAYNIEMQVARDYIEQRARYYHSQMDAELLLAGNKYNELPKSYVIFICCHDPLKMKKYVYNIVSRCKEVPELEYGDGVQTIFLSTKGTNDSEVSAEIIKFLNYVGADLSESTRDFESEFVKKLQASIARIKQMRGKEAEYMNTELIMQDRYDAGKAAGKAEGITEGLIQGESFTIAKVLRKNPHTDIAVALFDVSPEYVRQIASEHGIELID